MFNSVAKYLWGSAEDESDLTVQSNQQVLAGHQGLDDGEESHPLSIEECEQEDDWVLVGDAGSTTTPELTENESGERGVASDIAASRDLQDRSVQSRIPQREANVHQHRLSLEMIQKSQNVAQRKALQLSQSTINKQKCRRNNQVRELRSVPKGLVNRRNKQLRPSGYRSSRLPQRRSSNSNHV